MQLSPLTHSRSLSRGGRKYIESCFGHEYSTGLHLTDEVAMRSAAADRVRCEVASSDNMGWSLTNDASRFSLSRLCSSTSGQSRSSSSSFGSSGLGCLSTLLGSLVLRAAMKRSESTPPRRPSGCGQPPSPSGASAAGVGAGSGAAAARGGRGGSSSAGSGAGSRRCFDFLGAGPRAANIN